MWFIYLIAKKQKQINMESSSSEVGKFIDPEKIIGQAEIQEGIAVADFGCGPGYFSIPIAKIVGQIGRVYALDVLPQALETVQAKAKNSGLVNVITKRVNLEKEMGSKLEADVFDLVVMKDVLFQNQRKDLMIAEAYRILKPGGRVLVVEWGNGASSIGPESELRIAEDELKNIFVQQKFKIEKEIEAGDFHYSFLASK
jgi:ubiquinone/menaquinone biosynthesis C-methylase UbiE